VWEVTEGWEPLCRFLDVPAPDTPFPRLNDAETFRERFLSVPTG
jgi:Sulfotransferase domain